MNFKDNFFTDNILKFGGEITLEIFSLSINSLIEKYLPYFMIALNFQEICIDMKLACLLMTISTYPKVCRRYSITASTIYSWNSIQDLLIKHLSLKNATPKRIKYVLSKYLIANLRKYLTEFQLILTDSRKTEIFLKIY